MEYEILKLVWWVLIGVLLIGFAVTDGFDMGVLALLKILGKTDQERRVMLNTVGPHWDGNQVWFITAGGAIFAAWPIVYGVAFSGLYWALLLVLFALFFRPVGFEYRSKIEDERWRASWDILLTIGGAVPALVFGVAFGNLLLGLPFDMDDTMRSTYSGSFWQLLSPFAVLCGVVSLGMLMMHGANYLQMRVVGELKQRCQTAVYVLASLTLAGFVLAGVWVATQISGYQVVAIPDVNGVVTPLMKTVNVQPGAWLANYERYPMTIWAPLVAVSGLLLTMLMTYLKRAGFAFVFSSLAVVGIIATAGLSLFPFIVPSSLHPDVSLTVWDVVSSAKTLGIMLWAAMIFVPIILLYTLWGYYKMWGKITTEQVEAQKYGLY